MARLKTPEALNFTATQCQLMIARTRLRATLQSPHFNHRQWQLTADTALWTSPQAHLHLIGNVRFKGPQGQKSSPRAIFDLVKGELQLHSPKRTLSLAPSPSPSGPEHGEHAP